jgi:probable F420-dependent oxidoreductase
VRDFRFSFNVFGLTTRDALAQLCRQAEGHGYDTVFAADHLGAPAPFPLLVAAAEATERLRVGTLVLNAAFWNAALLAREVATTDILTNGRLEIGLGAGHMKWEFDAAGIGWEPFGERANHLAVMLSELQRFFTTDFEALPEGRKAPQPVQRRGFGGSGPPRAVADVPDPISDLTRISAVASTLRVSMRAAIDHLYNLTLMSESIRDELRRQVDEGTS